nr:hypothetical protein [Tanacetum cinerariifolium]
METCERADTLMVEKSKLDKDPQGKAVDPTHADHAGCQDTRKSMPGSMQLLGDRLRNMFHSFQAKHVSLIPSETCKTVLSKTCKVYLSETCLNLSERNMFKRNMYRLETIVPQKKETFQVVIDLIKNSSCFKAFTIYVDVPEIFMQQFWYSIKKVQGIDSYEFLLANKKCVVNVDVFRMILDIYLRVEGVNFTDVPYKHTNMFVDHMHQPWKTLATIINKCLSRKTENNDKLHKYRIDILWGMFYRENFDYPELILKDLAYQINHKKDKRSRRENMPFPQFTKVIINNFLKQHNSLSNHKFQHYHTIKDDGIVCRLKFVRIGKSISQTEAKEAEGARQVHATHARIMTESVPVPTRRRKSGKVTFDKLPNEENDEKEGDADDENDETESDEDDIYKYKIHVRKDEDEEMINAEVNDSKKEMLNAKVKDSDKGDKEVTNAAKADTEKTSEVKDDAKKTELRPTSSSSSVSSSFVDLEQESEKTSLEILKIKKEQAEKQKMLKFTIKNPANHRLYYALMEALIEDENAMDKGVDDTVQDHKRKHDDDVDPPVGPNQSKKRKRRRTMKLESSKKQSTTKETPKGKALSKGSKTGKSASIKEPVEERITKVVMDDAGDDVAHYDDQPQDASEPKTAKTPNPECEYLEEDKLDDEEKDDKKTIDDYQETVDVSEEFKHEPELVKRKTLSKRRVKKKVTLSADDKIISNDLDTALELGKSISKTKAEEAEVARQVHATYARIVIESVPKPTKRRKSSKVTSDPPKNLKDVPYLSLEEQVAANIIQALKENNKTSKRQSSTIGSSEGTGTISGVHDEENFDYPELILKDLAYQIDHKKDKRSRRENMPFPQFTKEFIRICALNLLDRIPELLHKDFWDIYRDSESLKARRVLDKINNHLKCLFLLWHYGF